MSAFIILTGYFFTSTVGLDSALTSEHGCFYKHIYTRLTTPIRSTTQVFSFQRLTPVLFFWDFIRDFRSLISRSSHFSFQCDSTTWLTCCSFPILARLCNLYPVLLTKKIHLSHSILLTMQHMCTNDRSSSSRRKVPVLVEGVCLSSPSNEQDVTQGYFYAELNRFEFWVFFSSTRCQTKFKELQSAGRRRVGFISFPMVLAQWEMQPDSSRIWMTITIISLVPPR